MTDGVEISGWEVPSNALPRAAEPDTLYGRGGWLSLWVDAGAALTVVVVFWLPYLIAAGGVQAVLGWGLAAATGTSMVSRWRFAAVAVAVSLAGTLAGWALGVSADPMLAVAWCLYPLAVLRAGRTSSLALAATGSMIALTCVVALPGGATRRGCSEFSSPWWRSAQAGCSVTSRDAVLVRFAPWSRCLPSRHVLSNWWSSHVMCTMSSDIRSA